MKVTKCEITLFNVVTVYDESTVWADDKDRYVNVTFRSALISKLLLTEFITKHVKECVFCPRIDEFTV